MEQNLAATIAEKVKPTMSRLRDRILENALESCDPIEGSADAKRTQEWLIALQMLEQVEDMKERRKTPQEAGNAEG